MVALGPLEDGPEHGVRMQKAHEAACLCEALQLVLLMRKQRPWCYFTYMLMRTLPESQCDGDVVAVTLIAVV